MVKRISKERTGEGGPTMRDVASRAGVSQATVSYVLNGKTGMRISPATRQRVLDTAALLHYHPNAIARAMVSGRSQTIGVYQPHTTHSLFSGMWTAAVMRGIGETLHSQRFHLLLYGYREAEEPPPSVFLDGRVDGLIVLAPHTEDLLPRQLASASFPTVIVGGGVFEGPCTATVDVDNVGGARSAVEHLIALGHRRIAHLSGPPSVPNAVDRRIGYEQALRSHGLPVVPEYLVEAGFSEEGGCRAALEVLQRNPPPTALFLANDLAAFGALQACLESGRRVPDEVALVGYDDAPISELARPKLTTMRQPAEALGQAAAEVLLTMISEGQWPEEKHRMFAAELVVRETSVRNDRQE